MKWILSASLLSMFAGGCAATAEEELALGEEELALGEEELAPGEEELAPSEEQPEAADSPATYDMELANEVAKGCEGKLVSAEEDPSLAGSYCVDQSYASAFRSTCEPWFMCPGSLEWHTQLSRGHRVRIMIDCGTYVQVESLWNGSSCYGMRRDALTPC
jgi:hypothetical protein